MCATNVRHADRNVQTKSGTHLPRTEAYRWKIESHICTSNRRNDGKQSYPYLKNMLKFHMLSVQELCMMCNTCAFQVERDAVLWNNKIYNSQSVLASTHSDELIVKFRRWFSQFYSENSPRSIPTSPPDLDW